MKRILLAVTMLAVVFPALRQAEARTDISIDFFYDNLGDDGSWIEAGDYGYCWQPTVAASNTSWRPYSDGYWAYTDVGWTWVSYEDFGWATYHYGRWIRLRGRGWAWAPGREWGPAWVSWRTGGDYVGWAPLPPRRGGDIYVDFSPITSSVDIDYDIGPAYYNFIDVRYIGEPVLRDRIFAADQNVTYVSKTVNVTNITYSNSMVYNHGPDYNVLSRYSSRPIQRLSVQRDANVDPAAAARSKSLMRVQGDKLVVAAPQQFQRPPKPVAPKVVKEKVAEATVEHGWEPVSDQKAQRELREKMSKEDPKVVPPRTVQASEKAATSPASSSATATSTTASETPATTGSATPARTTRTNANPAGATTTPVAPAGASASPTRDKGKDKRNETVSPGPSAAASVNPGLTPGTTPDQKNRNKRPEKAVPLATPGASVPRATTPAPNRDRGKNKQSDSVTPSASVPLTTGATETTVPNAAPKSAPKEKPEKRKVEPVVVPPPAALEKSNSRVAPPPIQNTQSNRLAPELAKPEAAVDKPKNEAPTAVPLKPKKEQAPSERVAPPSANIPANPPPFVRDEGKMKDKGKNEPVPSPTP
ncbi:MAG TPA: DUF6600 domain-containing protein [Chthoniobacterales bacterium]|nr:DUF6600 domain-containing protein [Chthoniobacterales bacterium]